MSSTSEVRHDEHTLELFNAYQTVVHKGEPFMSPSVFGPAREIASIGRRIINNIGEQESIDEDRERAIDSQFADQLVKNRRDLDRENDAAFKGIEELFQRVAVAIRLRVSP